MVMFADAVAFNSSVTFTNTSKLTYIGQMFRGATNFNQPITFSTDSLQYTDSMFFGATAFNQPIDFQANKLAVTTSMFANAVSFNRPVVLRNSLMLTTTTNMFANATSFNSMVNISSTANVTNMDFMFLNVGRGFGQSLANWNTDAVTNCSNFCESCGLPSFPRCDPCGGAPRRVSSSRGLVCKCPAAEPNCGADLCPFFQVTGSLMVDCLAPAPSPAGPPGVPPSLPPKIIISPLYNITNGDDHGNGSSTFVSAH